MRASEEAYDGRDIINELIEIVENAGYDVTPRKDGELTGSHNLSGSSWVVHSMDADFDNVDTVSMIMEDGTEVLELYLTDKGNVDALQGLHGLHDAVGAFLSLISREPKLHDFRVSTPEFGKLEEAAVVSGVHINI